MIPHICFVSPYIYSALVADSPVERVGGAEIQQALIARLLARHDFRVSVLTRDFGQPDFQTVAGVEIYKLPAAGDRGIKGLRWLTPRLTDIAHRLQDIAPDIVYVRTATAYAAPAAWYATRHGARFIHAGASDLDFLPTRNHRLSIRDWALYRWGLKRASSVLVQNQKQLLDASRNCRQAVQLCPNFFVEDIVKPADPAGPVLWVGTIRDLKRPELFVELARRFPQRRFVMVGAAQDDEISQALSNVVDRDARALGNMELLGYVPPERVGAHFDGAAVFVNTSTDEGFPNTFLQSWIRGLPTLSFVQPETVPGLSGTQACSCIDEMSRALQALLSDAGHWRSRSEFVRAHFISHHSESAALERYLRILRPAGNS